MDRTTGTLRYTVGDVTQPNEHPVVIVHCNNNIGAWGGGVSGPIGRRFPQALKEYREWDAAYAERQEYLPGGEIQVVAVEDQIWVGNLIGQHETVNSKNPKPIRYEWIAQGLAKLRSWIGETRQGFDTSITVAMPRMGAGLAGGNWTIIEAIVLRELVLNGINVVVYDREQDVAKWEETGLREYREIAIRREDSHERA